MKNIKGNDQFLNLYQDELSYLRDSGKQFAQKYPQVAQNLDLSDQGSSDPHVERLLESFAFMLDSNFTVSLSITFILTILIYF
jgi:type VI protein secretion system component VasA